MRHFVKNLSYNGIAYAKFVESTTNDARAAGLLTSGYIELPSPPPSGAHRFVNGEWTTAWVTLRHFYDPATGRYSHSSECAPDDVPTGLTECSSRPPAKALYKTTDGITWVEDVKAVATKIAADGTRAIQKYLDAKAQELRYDNIHTACGWAGQFADATALKVWGASCWKKAGEIEAAVKTGQKYNPAWGAVVPTEAELLAELPALVLP